MAQIPNPILNSPYAEPKRHWLTRGTEILDEVVEQRRLSSYLKPVPEVKRKRKGKDANQFGLDFLVENEMPKRREHNQVINGIRELVGAWRRSGYPNVTPTTRKLLEHWNDAERVTTPLFYCQIEAVETAIFITEVAKKAHQWLIDELHSANLSAVPDHPLPRMAFKMATGSGKTVVMGMLIAWQALNKLANPMDKHFGDAFLIVTPGITIRDRLRVLYPAEADNVYVRMDLVPSDLRDELNRTDIVITNYHAFMQRTHTEMASNTRKLLAADEDPFVETPAQMVARVCGAFGTRKNIIVINDEAHHCYRGKPEIALDEPKLKGDDLKDAKKRDDEARVWHTGLEHIDRKLGIRQIFDLSATPFFLSGSGYSEGTLFPWVVSDFSLIDAIEAGIVKIPRVPTIDNTGHVDPRFRVLYHEIRDELPKGTRGKSDDVLDPARLPDLLEGALRSLYHSYEQAHYQYEKDVAAGISDGRPPVFIVVCNNGLNRCVRTRVNGAGVVHVYDGLQRIQDRDEHTGDLLAEYTYVQGQLHKWRTPSTEHWVFTEPQGGWPRHLFDDTGALTDSFDFDWNGQELLHQGTTDAPISWGGGWKLGPSTALPLLLMPGTNEVWSPTLGKSMNPLASMSQALPYGVAVGGYTGEVIGLPVRLPVIPSWGSGPGYPWWPGQSGPGGPVQMQQGNEQSDGGLTIGQLGNTPPFKTPKHAKGCPPPNNWQTPCDCCADELAEGTPGYSGLRCEEFEESAHFRSRYNPSLPPTPGPVRPVPPTPTPNNPATQQDCADCAGLTIPEAIRQMATLVNCLPQTLWDCINNSLKIGNPGTPAIWCVWHPGYANTYACTMCKYNPRGIWINCSLGRSVTSLAQTVVHEMIHWCKNCLQGDEGCKSSVWDAIQSCMVVQCAYDCNGLLTHGDHDRHCRALLETCTALVVGCGWWSCNAYVYQVSGGYAVRIWGSPQIFMIPFHCNIYYTQFRRLRPESSSDVNGRKGSAA